MSQENVEIIQGMAAAMDRGDWEAAFSYAAPDVKYDGSRNLGEWRGIYEGREEVKRVWATFFEQWESWRTGSSSSFPSARTWSSPDRPATFAVASGSR